MGLPEVAEGAAVGGKARVSLSVWPVVRVESSKVVYEQSVAVSLLM